MNDDLTARAKLRDAAIELIAEGQTATARSVAARANVSSGLIRHHFGTMNGLLLACDEQVAALIRDAKNDAIQGPLPDVISAMRATGQNHIMSYLAYRLTESSSAIDALVDAISEDAAKYIQRAIDAGLMTPCPNVEDLAKMLTLYSLGSLVLHRHMKRLLDLDVTTPDLVAEPGLRGYIQLQFWLFSSLLTPELLEHYRGQLEEL